MTILEENFKWHLEAFASELFIYFIVTSQNYTLFSFFISYLNAKVFDLPHFKFAQKHSQWFAMKYSPC